MAFHPAKKESKSDEHKKWISNIFYSSIDDPQKRKIVKDVLDSEDMEMLTPEVMTIIKETASNFPEGLQMEILSALSSIHYYDELSENFKSALNTVDWIGRLKTISLESDLSDKQKQFFLMEATFAVLCMPGHTVKDLKNNLAKYLRIPPEKAEELDNAFCEMVMLPLLEARKAAN